MTASALSAHLGPLSGAIFAIVLLNSSLIGAAAVTLSTTYAFGDVFKVRHSLHRSWRDARAFYLIYGGLVGLAGVIVLLPNAPLGLITTAVQALAGILLPSATVFLLLLCNDRAVLGPWVNGLWVNALASVIVGVLIELSLILAAATLLPGLNVTAMLVGFTVLLVLALSAIGGVSLRRRAAMPCQTASSVAAQHWRMPPLAELPRPVWSASTRAGMLVLRIYLVAAALLLVVKMVQLASVH